MSPRALVVALVFAAGCASRPERNPRCVPSDDRSEAHPDGDPKVKETAMEPTSKTSSALEGAIRIALDFIAASSQKTPDDYRLISAENQLQGADASPTRWRLGFKLAALIPAAAGEIIGKGGDFFVEVDTATRSAHWAKGGH